MKTFKIFAVALATLSLAFTGCKDDEPVAPGKVIQRGDEACRIESFVLNLTNGDELKADAYDYDKTIEIGYATSNVAFLDGATATYTLSEGATIAPDPAVAMDYSEPIEFTVTAPDGKTTRVYTTVPVEKVADTYVKPTEVAVKTLGELGTAAGATAVGVSGTDLVLGNEVFDAKTFAKKGDLNLDGLPENLNQRVVWLSNDDKGVLIGTFSDNGGYEGTTSNGVWAWKEGWDKAPVCILGPTGGAYLSGHLSITGDFLTGTSRIVASNQGGGAGGNHMIWTFQSGVRDNAGNYNISTGIGSVWAQQVSPSSIDLSGPWFGYAGVTGNVSDAFYWSGWTPTAAATTPAGITHYQGDTGSGPTGMGNHNMGSVRSFVFDGKPLGAVISQSWPAMYLSVVDADGEFILSPATGQYPFSVKAPNFGGVPQAAYIYSEADHCGYIYVFNSVNGLVVWKLEVAAL